MLAFGFSFVARIERDRTIKALALRKAQGVKLGRPEGSINVNSKLEGKENDIANHLRSKVPIASIARIVGADRRTFSSFIKQRNLKLI